MFKLTINNFPTKGFTESRVPSTRLFTIREWLSNMFDNQGVGYMHFADFNNRYNGGKLFYSEEQDYCSIDVSFYYLYDTNVANQIRTCLESTDYCQSYCLTADFGNGCYQKLMLVRTPPPQIHSSMLTPSEVVFRCDMLEEHMRNIKISHDEENENMRREIAMLSLQLEQSTMFCPYKVSDRCLVFDGRRSIAPQDDVESMRREIADLALHLEKEKEKNLALQLEQEKNLALLEQEKEKNLTLRDSDRNKINFDLWMKGSHYGNRLK